MNTHIRWKYVECLPVESESTPWVMTIRIIRIRKLYFDSAHNKTV